MKTNATTAAQTAAPATAGKGSDAKAQTATTGADGAATGEPAKEEVKPDPFANLPRIKLADTDNVLDLSSIAGSPARKYEKVHADASTDKLPVQRGWKHATAVFVPGTNKGGENGFRPGSVYGTIADIVNRAGRSGITAQEVVTQVRQRQMGANKRSHFCVALPPVGWAEGWLNTAVTKNIVGVHATKRAPALTVVTAPKGEEATDAQNKAALAAPATKEGEKAAKAA